MLKDLLKPALLITVLALIFQACNDEAVKTYTVAYDLNGGTGTLPASQTFKAGGNGITLNNGAGLTKTGFTFSGWAEKANTNVAITNPYTPSSDVTLYAIWTPVYTVTYNLNGGSGTAPASQTYTQGGTGLTLNNGDGLSRPGFTFGGWAETSDGKTSLASPFKPSRDMAVYAIWNAVSYTVSYDLNGGTGVIPAPQTYTQGGSPITLNNGSGLVKTGSTFSGWSAWANSNVAVVSPYTPTAGITLYAIWVVNTTTYTITYNINGGTGTTPENQTYTVNGNPVSLRAGTGFTKSGFTFGGWATSASGTTAVGNPFTPTGNTALFAIWTQGTATYTISYNVNGGTGTTPPAQTYSGAPVALNDGSGLTKTNFTFFGWGDGTGSTTAVANPFTPTRDITLYAIWRPNTYTITYNINGGTGTIPENQTYTVNGNPVSLRAGTGFTKSGLTFGGWATSASGTTAVGNPFTPAGNTALFAIWTQSTTYTISYNVNGGTGTTPSAQTYSGTPVALNDGSGLTKTNFTFAGWGDGVSSTTAVANPFTPTRDITLYAIWTASAQTFTVSFNLSSASGNPPSNQTYTENGEPLALPTNVIRQSYTFAGWAAASGGTTAVANPYRPTANITLYAIWTPNFVVTFDLNGGSGNPPAQQTYTGGDGIALPTAATRTDYTFGGWAVSSSSSNSPAAVANPYRPTASVALYAIWTPNFVVTFNLNGGSGNPPVQQTYTGGNGIALPTTATRTDYTFGGWTVSSSSSNSPAAVANPYSPTASVTLYAIWTPNFVVTFDLNGGSGNPPAQQTYTGGNGIALPTTTATRSGYTFSGWAETNTAATALTSPYTPTSSKTLYAVWAAAGTSYTVAYDISGGTGTTPTSQTYSGTALVLNNGSGITKSGGVVFQGWATTQGGTTGVDNPYTPAGNVTLYAIWSTATTFALTAKSTSFTDNSTTDPLKIRHAYFNADGSPGSNISPGFNWTQAPTKFVAQYIMVCYDISVTFFHFYYEMPTSTTGLNEGVIPQPDPNNQQSVGLNNYQGPWPPAGDTNFHDYQFRVYAVKAGYTISNFTGSHTDIMTNNANYIMGYSNIVVGKFKY